MGEQGGHNIYTLLSVLLIILGVIFIIIIFKPNSLEFAGFKADKMIQNNDVQAPKKYNLEGKWDMVFDFKRCSNQEFSNKDFKCFYNVELFQHGNVITGNGNKHSEIFEGETTVYSKDFPVKIKEGRIKGDTLVANFYEKNSLKEVTGVIEVPLDKEFIFDGIYIGKNGNCDGYIQLKRIQPKPIPPQK